MTSIFLNHFDALLSTPEDVEQLNRAILHLAVQGKLVLQDSQDEPAEILYKRILKEKERNLNGRTPRSMPSISQDEIPFEIPSNWVWTRLGEISNYGEAVKTKTLKFTDETWVLDLEDIEKTTSRLIQKVRLKNRQFQSEKNVFQKGDVIYGKLRPYLDKVIVADEDGMCSSELIPIKTYGNINPFYLRLTLKRPDFINYVNGKTYGVKMPRLGTQDARMALVPLPPLAEQQRIVTCVEELFVQTRALAKELAYSQMELDGLNKSALSHLLASETPEEFNQRWDFIAEHFDLLFQSPEHITPLRQSILELAVRGKLTRREAGDESAKELLKCIGEERAKLGKDEVLSPIKEREKQFTLPDGWEWVKLAEIAEIGTGVAKGKKYEEKEKVITLPYLRVANVQRGYLDLAVMKEIDIREDEALKYFLKDGDLLLTEGGDADKLGRSAIWHGEVESCIHQNHIFRARPYLTLKSEWLMLYTNSPYGRNYFLGASKQTTNLASINKTQLNNCPIPFPPLAEQERIVKRVEQLLSLCDALEARLQSAEEERGRLVRAVMATVGG